MNIYIPPHLRKIGILKNLCDIITEYSKNYVSTGTSFDDYQTYLKIDPVLRFISLCISEDEVDQDYKTTLNYLTHLFYSIKGTTKVFDYMHSFLGLQFEGDIVYTSKVLSFSLSGIKGSDASLFNSYLKEFIESLLYFETMDYKLSEISITIKSDTEAYTSNNIITYKRFKDIMVYEN